MVGGRKNHRGIFWSVAANQLDVVDSPAGRGECPGLLIPALVTEFLTLFTSRAGLAICSLGAQHILLVRAQVAVDPDIQEVVPLAYLAAAGNHFGVLRGLDLVGQDVEVHPVHFLFHRKEFEFDPSPIHKGLAGLPVGVGVGCLLRIAGAQVNRTAIECHSWFFLIG